MGLFGMPFFKIEFKEVISDLLFLKIQRSTEFLKCILKKQKSCSLLLN